MIKHDQSIYTYAAEYSDAEPVLLRELNRNTNIEMLYPQMLSGHHQGRLLAMLSKVAAPLHILEIGTFTGYSAMCLAEGLKPGGVVHTIEMNAEFESRIQKWIKRAGMENRIRLHVGKALEVIPVLASEINFDLVFIDADKAEYPDYYRLLRQHLLSGALIIADNVLWDGKVISEPDKSDKDTLGIQTFNKIVADDPGTEQVIIPVRDGLSLIRIK